MPQNRLNEVLKAVVREKIAKCWAGLKNFDGALGIITMNELGVNVGLAWPLTVKRGVFTLAG